MKSSFREQATEIYHEIEKRKEEKKKNRILFNYAFAFFSFAVTFYLWVSGKI